MVSAPYRLGVVRDGKDVVAHKSYRPNVAHLLSPPPNHLLPHPYLTSLHLRTKKDAHLMAQGASSSCQPKGENVTSLLDFAFQGQRG